MNTLKLLPLTLLVLPMASFASGFACGKYNPNAAITPSSNLALTNTAMLASPGHPNLPSTYSDSTWFLIDSFGTGALAGCLPKRSVIEGWGQTNQYNKNGTLSQITAKRFNTNGGDPIEATLKFTYEKDNPYYLKTAENFCMAIGGDKVTYDMSYSNGLLSTVTITPDNTCPSTAVVLVSYEYNDREAPSLPSKMTVEESGKSAEVTNYDYQVTDGNIQSISMSSSSSGDITLKIGHTGNQITSMTASIGGRTALDFALKYNTQGQWLHMLDPRYNWGLKIEYYKTSKIESTLQNTGDPGAQADHFYY